MDTVASLLYMSKFHIKQANDVTQLLRSQRIKQKITQTQLADFTRLHRKGIEKVEGQNSDPKLSTLLKLAEVLGVHFYVEIPDELT